MRVLQITIIFLAIAVVYLLVKSFKAEKEFVYVNSTKLISEYKALIVIREVLA